MSTQHNSGRPQHVRRHRRRLRHRGGWAAKELCEKGLKTLVLERGRNVEHIKDYPTATKNPWELPHRGQLTRKVVEQNPVMSMIAAEDAQHFFVKDAEHPYVQEKPFDWIRGYQVGGKSLMWGRACQRWSHFEFTAPDATATGSAGPSATRTSHRGTRTSSASLACAG